MTPTIPVSETSSPVGIIAESNAYDMLVIDALPVNVTPPAAACCPCIACV